MLAYRASMGSSDLDAAKEQFDSEGIPHENMAWFYNPSEDRWEVYDRGADVGASDTLKRYFKIGTGWVEA